MPFSNIWGRVLHILVHMLLTRVTRVPMNHRQVIPVVVCDQISKRTFKMKKVWGTNEVGRFFVTGATDAAGKPSHFYCRFCRKDVSVLAHGPHEILRHYQWVKQFARDQRLRLETPGCRVLDFEGNPLSESELERRRENIPRGPLVVRDREYPFALPRI